MKNRQELENDFEWWITCIPDKIDRLQELIPENVFKELDYSIDSLLAIGKYVIDQVATVNDMTKQKELWDCLASYVGTTYRRNVPSAEWYIELDDVKNLYYAVPCLRTKVNTNFYPFYEITAMIDRKKTDFIFDITQKHIELQKK